MLNQVKPAATVCRPAVSECDLAEYCNGVNNLCPVDVFLQEGTDCGGGEVRTDKQNRKNLKISVCLVALISETK